MRFSLHNDILAVCWTHRLFPTTLMLRVSLTPWRKRFAVMAGFPLSAPQQTCGCCYYCCLLDPSLLDPSPLPFKGGFRSLTRFSLHNDISAVGPLLFCCWNPLLWLSKAIFRSLTRFSLYNYTTTFWLLDPVVPISCSHLLFFDFYMLHILNS